MHYSRILFFLLALSLLTACANVIPPSGGKTDTTPPKLLSIKPQDSLLNTRVNRIEMKFDEFVVVSDAGKELHISPILAQTPLMTVSGKTVIVKIADSLLHDSTTYTIDFGKSIKDLHEGNPYKGSLFMFSTGPWFDSLSLKGIIMNAETGRIDSSGTAKALLYDAALPYDIVTMQKPSYVANSGSDGSFVVKGLPKRSFRVFILKESGDNLVFDDDQELIGFADTIFTPGLDTAAYTFRIFKEIPDTAKAKTDTTLAAEPASGMKKRMKASAPKDALPEMDAKSFNYRVIVDTADRVKRTHELTQPLTIFFSRKADTLNQDRIFLSADSNGVESEVRFALELDTSRRKLTLSADWKPNTLYTLRLLKRFALDTGAAEAMPSRYTFRTKSEEDYGRMEINLPEKYVGKPNVLQVRRDEDSVYLNPVTGAKVVLKRLLPGNYSIAIIKDLNGDGEWTTGELKKHRHAELVIPYANSVLMKAGWEHVVDFEPSPKLQPKPAAKPVK
ncbi:MAG TPA: Ig-like domain-containing protein [Chitinophagaceae bacterium]|nr:Ig-like domain-containing protein [Chitinophagaceae bacterium]